MKVAVVTIFAVLLVALLCSVALRCFDFVAEHREMTRLRETQAVGPDLFHPEMVVGLPDPARRFFTYAIAEGTPLYTVAELTMVGEFRLGNPDEPRPMRMTATQVLAAPDGFIWQMDAGAGFGHISGSDTAFWTRFWLDNCIPVARSGKSQDHRLSAFGRVAAEAVIWTPAAVLPGPNVRWEPVDDTTARMIMQHQGMEQAVDLTIAPDGRPTQIAMQRWSDQNPQKTYRFQPFGGVLSAQRSFAGFQIPTHVEAGHFFGTDAYFPFFIVDVTDVTFPTP